jgi:putative transposase
VKVQKAYRYELKPNNLQKTMLAKHAGVARFAYNWALARRIEEYKTTGRSSNAMEQHRQLNALKKTEFPWMYEVSKCAPQEALRNLDRAYENFFRRVKNGENPGFPKFKKKGLHDSFRLTGSIKAAPGQIPLPRLGDIRTKEEITVKERILSATIRRTVNRWFVSSAVEKEIPNPKPTQGPMVRLRSPSVLSEVEGPITGIDLGLTKFLQLSDSTAYDSIYPLKKLLSKLQFASKSHSRKQKGSKNRKKSAIKLARLHYRIQCKRADTLHKLTTLLAKTKSVICVESLNIKGMVRNRPLARSIADAAWGEFIRQLEYKCRWYGSVLIFAPKNFPSTKMCSRSRHIKESISLLERVYHCDICGLVIDRDLNSALNLENYARQVLGLTTASSAGSNACGEAVQQYPSMKQEENAVCPDGING